MNSTGVLFYLHNKTRREGYSLMSEKFMKVDEVAEELDCSKTHAYVIMRKLNTELSKQGYIITKGRLSRRYFQSEFYG